MNSETKQIIKEVRDKLHKFNNDKKFIFDPEPHKYYYDGIELTSVTTFLKNFSIEFNEHYHSKRKAIDLGLTQEEVLELWRIEKERGCNHGTIVHDYIENYIKDSKTKYPKDDGAKICCESFKSYYDKKMANNLEYISLEQRIYDIELGISGTIDGIFYGREKLYVGDWKTNKELKTDSDYCYNNMLLTPFKNLKENEFNKYSIQVSLYRLLLERAGIVTDGGFILHINRAGVVTVHKALDLVDKLKMYFNKKLYNIPIIEEPINIF